ncbi:LCP family protein [Propionicicella superfundia]|uniref:LCP family protein n=1 Tax=Propionicicella superfundia TaxID=348582 RepID=UPI000424360B|nr:LCP family protein [Propionicicella superfundia]
MTDEKEQGLPDPGKPGPRRGRPSRLWRWLVALIIAIALIAGGATGYAVWRTKAALSAIQRDPGLLPSTGGAESSDADGSPLNILVVGSDSRGDDAGRSDALLIAHVTANRDKVYLISFPRDLYVNIPGHGENKINAAHSLGGTALTAETLEALLGITIDHAVSVDFEGFLSLSDTVGEITVWNETSSRSGEYRFPRGELTLQSDALLAYVRQRYGLPNGDLDRAKRQRTVLRAMLVKLSTRETLSDPAKLDTVLSEVGGYLTVDAGLSDETILRIGASLKLDAASDILTLQAPTTGFGTSPDGASIDLYDPTSMSELGAALRDDGLRSYTSRHDSLDEDY